MTEPYSPFDVNDLSNKREVGSDPGTLWSLSSHKPGYGVRQLRDPDLERLWQSDGVQPHKIDIEFAKMTAVTHISIWMNVKRDDSYTPTKIQVTAGTGWHDMNEVRYRDWDSQGEPFGWKHFYLSSPNPRSTHAEETEFTVSDASALATDQKLKPINVWVLQINILANQQNGKDTHIRGCLVWGPKEKAVGSSGPAPLVSLLPSRNVDGVDEDEASDEDGGAQDLNRPSMWSAGREAQMARDLESWRALR